MQTPSDTRLLRDYAEYGQESAFAEIVARHTNLVYSAALRQVESPDAAAEVAQQTLIGLAHGAQTLSRKLADDASLAGWLCRSARNLSLNHRRDEFRRHNRERQAMAQHDPTPETAPDWEQLRPVLDEAMAELNEPDYDALVMRFYQNQDLRSVGQALGLSDDAAQKRVSRALDKLRDLLSRRGITTSAAALSIVISANAIQAAPVGLAATISTAAALGGTTIASAATATATKAVVMTTLQKTIIGVTLTAAVGTGIYEARQAAKLREQNQSLQQQQASLIGQNQQLQRERDDATNRLASVADENARLNRSPTEVLKLRGQVGSLRNQLQATTSAAQRTPGPGETANVFNNPAMRKGLAQARLAAYRMMYAPLLKEMKLKPEEAEKFINLLGDNWLRIQDQSGSALRGEITKEMASQTIRELKNELESSLQALLGPERYAQYQKFNLNQQESKLNRSVQQTLDSLVKVLPENPLGEEQRRRLSQLLRDSQLTALETTSMGEMPTSSEEIEQGFQRQAERDRNVLQQAGSFLTAEQLAALASLQAEQISQKRENAGLLLQMMGVSGSGQATMDNRGK